MRNTISRGSRLAFAIVWLGLAITTAQAQNYSLSTTVSYSGRQSGDVWILASTNQTVQWNWVMRVSPPTNGAFTNLAVTVTNFPAGVSYHLFAWRDSNTNASPDVTEAQAWHPNGPFMVTSNQVVAGFVLSDPDNDADGLPDWWENNYGLPVQIGLGTSGSLTVGAGNTNYADTTLANVVGSNLAGSTNLSVTTTNGFSKNDLILIIAMQDANTNFAQNTAGTYQLTRIASVTNNVLTLRQPLSNPYNASSNLVVQVLKVPEFSTATINGVLTCSPWNGTNGGVLAFVANVIALGSNGVISADGKGYRGGDDVPPDGSNKKWGFAGERTTGVSTSRETNSLERAQGGGGTGKHSDGSGGGGGYGGQGQNGNKTQSDSDYGRGASPYGTNTLSRLYVGGGGGSSSCADNGRPGVGGGAGGGVLFIAAGAIQGSGRMSSSGSPGKPGIYAHNEVSGSGGGGGAGGSLYLLGSLTNSLQIAATGGAGGPRALLSTSGWDGGTGGVGRIRLDLPKNATVPTNASPAVGYVGQLPLGYTILPNRGAYDSDQDGIPDLEEYQLNTNPVSADTDGDGMPDKWELDHNLDPTNPNDASTYPRYGPPENPSYDKLTYLQKYLYGLDPTTPDTDNDGLTDYEELFIYHTNPFAVDTDGDGVSDWNEVKAVTDPLSTGNQFYYDRIGRLVGARYENGLGLGYEYDRNHNILQQVYLSQFGNTNGAPNLWEFINGLTNSPSAYVDSDGDGWSDYQEWIAGSDPTDPSSVPNVYGAAGTNLFSLQLPFAVSNFVVGVGQLDGVGAEEIIVGGDGNPGTSTNFIVILSQSVSGWSTQRVDVGCYGVTSIAVGQPANHTAPVIYLGLRQPGGTGSVAEVVFTAGQWTLNSIASSTNEAAFVLGVRAGKDVLVSLAATNRPPGSVYYLLYDGNTWASVLANTNLSNRGLGAMTELGLHSVPRHGVRLLDSGGLEVIGQDVGAPAGAVWKEEYSRWFFLTPDNRSWDDAQAYALTFGGNLATVADAAVQTWIWSQYGNQKDIWIGLLRDGTGAPWEWVSGTRFNYSNWLNGQPDGSGVMGGYMNATSGQWDDTGKGNLKLAAIEISPVEGPPVTANEPTASRRLLWRGQSVCGGNLRLTNNVSLIETFVDDKNSNSVVNAGDDFVVAEYLFSGSAVSTVGVQRIALSGSSLAPSYGLASVDMLSGNQQALFTAEPDGSIYIWMATNVTAQLQRQLFSCYHQGMAWHALAGVRTLESGQSLVGLRVDPLVTQRCDVILWPAQSSPTPIPDVPQTAPIVTVLSGTNALGAVAQVPVLVTDGEGSPSWLELQYSNVATLSWSSATIDGIDGTAYGAVSAMPTGYTHRVTWNTGAIFPVGVTNNIWLRARASDVSLTGSWSPVVAYQVVIPATADSVGDGIPDSWRQQYFGGNGTTTNNLSCATCDADGTGQNNRFKYIAGLDPTNAASVFVLKVANVAGQPTQKQLTFRPLATGRTYAPQYRTNLVFGSYATLAGYTGPTSNSTEVTVTDMSAVEPTKFYRINISLP